MLFSPLMMGCPFSKRFQTQFCANLSQKFAQLAPNGTGGVLLSVLKAKKKIKKSKLLRGGEVNFYF
jgi:hypothetical protein